MNVIEKRIRTWKRGDKGSNLRLAGLAQVCHNGSLHEADAHPKDNVGSEEHCDGSGEAIEQPPCKEGDIHQDHRPLAAKELHDEPRYQASYWLADECNASCNTTHKIWKSIWQKKLTNYSILSASRDKDLRDHVYSD